MLGSSSCVAQMLALLLLAAPSVLGVSIISVLATFDELSILNSHINASQSLTTALLAANNATFIAPSNTAFEAYLDAMAPFKPTEFAITELIFYHFLAGVYPGALFTTASRFIPSYLPNGETANVTGGQVVEILTDNDGNPQLISGTKTISPIVQEDILFSGGIIHIVDQILSIPSSLPVELTDSHLSLGIALLSDAGLLSTTTQNTLSSVFDAGDITIFMPNSQLAIDSFHTMSTIHSSIIDRATIFNYHQIPDLVGYSYMLENGATWRTGQGKNIKFTVQGNDTFIDGAKIIGKDYLIANGVMHIIDDMLDPFNVTTPPAITSKHGASRTVLGVSLAFALLLPVCIGIVFFRWNTKRRQAALAKAKEIDFGEEGDGAYVQQTTIPANTREEFELDDSPPMSNREEILYAQQTRIPVSVRNEFELDSPSNSSRGEILHGAYAQQTTSPMSMRGVSELDNSPSISSREEMLYTHQTRTPASIRNEYELEDLLSISNGGEISQSFSPSQPPPPEYSLLPGHSRVEPVELEAGSVRRT